jgi:hypothetical protein
VGVTAVLGLLLSALSDLPKKGQDLLGGDDGKILVFAEMVTELGEGGAVGLDRVFFQSSFCGTLCRLGLPGRVS